MAAPMTRRRRPRTWGIRASPCLAAPPTRAWVVRRPVASSSRLRRNRLPAAPRAPRRRALRLRQGQPVPSEPRARHHAEGPPRGKLRADVPDQARLGLLERLRSAERLPGHHLGHAPAPRPRPTLPPVLLRERHADQSQYLRRARVRRGHAVTLRHGAVFHAARAHPLLFPVPFVPRLLAPLLPQARAARFLAGGPLHAHGAAPPRLGDGLRPLHVGAVLVAESVRFDGNSDAERVALPGGLRAGAAGACARDPGYAALA